RETKKSAWRARKNAGNARSTNPETRKPAGFAPAVANDCQLSSSARIIITRTVYRLIAEPAQRRRGESTDGGTNMGFCLTTLPGCYLNRKADAPSAAGNLMAQRCSAK